MDTTSPVSTDSVPNAADRCAGSLIGRARRQRQPLSFRSWLKRQVRRLAIATAAFLAGYIAIKGLGGEPLQDSLSTLAGGPGSWFGR